MTDNPNNYLEGTYTGRDPELNVLVRAIQDYQHHSPEAKHLALEERQVLRKLYLQLIWCDSITIRFHKRAASE